MTKAEKVIKGLECCGLLMDCAQCPYDGEDNGCFTILKGDALELLKERQWVSVKARPPEVGQRVLILSRYGHVSDAVFNQYDDEHYFDPFGYELSDGYVTHWMPRPEEPREGDEE